METPETTPPSPPLPPVGSDYPKHDTKLFLVYDGGETYYVSAITPERVLPVLILGVGEIEEWADDPPRVREVTREDLQGTKFTFEDGEQCSMWNAYSLVRGTECMVASTLI